MVKHGALSKSHVYKLLRSKDARVRRAAFTLLETSNPRLRRNSELFIEITRFIWDANPSYEVYQEFTKRHFQARYKVHELIGARLKIEKQNKQRAAADPVTDNTRHGEGGFFNRLFGRPCAAAKVAKLGGRKRAEVREAAAASRRLRIVAPCTRHRPTTRVSFARARLIGVQVFLCPFDVIVMQQFAAISLRDGPRARRLNWPF